MQYERISGAQRVPMRNVAMGLSHGLLWSLRVCEGAEALTGIRKLRFAIAVAWRVIRQPDEKVRDDLFQAAHRRHEANLRALEAASRVDDPKGRSGA